MPHRSAAQMYRAARKSDALLTGAPLPTLFYFALPIILGNIFQQLYSIVDAIVVGKFLGDLPLAGISVAAPIVDVANALVIGGTIGIGVLCAQMCGAEDWMRLRCMNATALLGGAAADAGHCRGRHRLARCRSCVRRARRRLSAARRRSICSWCSRD